MFFSCESDKNNEIFINPDIVKDSTETETISEEELNEYSQPEVSENRSNLESAGIDPLEIFLGKWFLLDSEGNIDESNSYIKIYLEDSEYRFDFKYYSTIDKGYLKPGAGVTTSLNKDNGHVIHIVGQPFEKDDTLVFLVDSEGPLGFFQRE
jgi:hypothetical protein